MWFWLPCSGGISLEVKKSGALRWYRLDQINVCRYVIRVHIRTTVVRVASISSQRTLQAGQDPFVYRSTAAPLCRPHQTREMSILSAQDPEAGHRRVGPGLSLLSPGTRIGDDCDHILPAPPPSILYGILKEWSITEHGRYRGLVVLRIQAAPRTCCFDLQYLAHPLVSVGRRSGVRGGTIPDGPPRGPRSL